MPRAPAARTPPRAGFTLLEVAIALAIAAFLATMAVPSFGSLVARQRLNATLHTLRADIAMARQEASRRGLPVHLSFMPGAQWCYLVTTGPETDCHRAEPSPGNGVLRVVRAGSQPGVQLQAATPMALDGRRGASLYLGSHVRFASAEGQQGQLNLSAMGHTSLCAPGAPVSGMVACAKAGVPGVAAGDR